MKARGAPRPGARLAVSGGINGGVAESTRRCGPSPGGETAVVLKKLRRSLGARTFAPRRFPAARGDCPREIAWRFAGRGRLQSHAWSHTEAGKVDLGAAQAPVALGRQGEARIAAQIREVVFSL
jgi:hypothetical protein